MTKKATATRSIDRKGAAEALRAAHGIIGPAAERLGCSHCAIVVPYDGAEG